MGVDAKLLIDVKYTTEHIMDYMKARPERFENVKYIPTQYSYFAQISFVYKGENEQEREPRMIAVFSPYSSGLPFTVTLLNLGSWGKSTEILTGIASVFGGFFCEADATDSFVLIGGSLYDSNGLPFFVKRSIIEGSMRDENDGKGLKRCVDDWNASVGNSHVKW